MAGRWRRRLPRMRATTPASVLSALALGLLPVKELLTALEGEGAFGGELHHLLIFDLAWPIFVVSWLATACHRAAAARARARPTAASRRHQIG